MNQHKLTPSSITSLAQTRSLRYVRSSTRCGRRRRERSEGRIDEDDEIETLVREERRRTRGRPERESEENFTMPDGRQDATAEWLLVPTPRHHYSHQYRMRCMYICNLHGRKLSSLSVMLRYVETFRMYFAINTRSDANVRVLGTLESKVEFPHARQSTDFVLVKM